MTGTVLRWSMCIGAALLLAGAGWTRPRALSDRQLDAVYAAGFEVKVDLGLDVSATKPDSVYVQSGSMSSISSLLNSSMNLATTRLGARNEVTADPSGATMPNLQNLTVNNINISQNAKRTVFLGTFTANGLEVAIEGGRLRIVKEGSVRKFTKAVEHKTFSGDYATEAGQPVIYVTERAVFELGPGGLELTEIAPGVDLEREVLGLMEFAPVMRGAPRLMDPRTPDMLNSTFALLPHSFISVETISVGRSPATSCARANI